MNSIRNAPAPWHEGERALHARAGVADRLAEAGTAILRDHMPAQHQALFAELPLLYAGTLDAEGQPWASVLAGPPGFAHARTPRLLRVEAQPLAGDAAAGNFSAGAPIGVLGLQAQTRRRNRLNGWIAESDALGFTVEAGQSFGNCPRFIQPRDLRHAPAAGEPSVRMLPALDAAALRLVREADTFFIASAHPEARRSRDPAAGVDVSHRGGPAGFVQLDARGLLLVPDYAGNTFFNTLGNLLLEPRCGLLFVDFASGERLQLAARAELRWDTGARSLRLEVLRAVHSTGGLPLRLAG
ncbi:MAG: pyridoxamine 5-phosphate oxidase family protein [Ramlibacter sp.]|nr:pyridoxamine 5-phosphate oxidase family protein [Ramlibacter sp.]